MTYFTLSLKVNGLWGQWNDDGCTVKCGRGQRIRKRSCDCPKPMNGGKFCEGRSMEITQETCEKNPCPGKCHKLKSSLNRKIIIHNLKS